MFNKKKLMTLVECYKDLDDRKHLLSDDEDHALEHLETDLFNYLGIYSRFKSKVIAEVDDQRFSFDAALLLDDGPVLWADVITLLD